MSCSASISASSALRDLGKSCVVATILNAVIERNPNAHVMLLDPHSEYVECV